MSDQPPNHQPLKNDEIILAAFIHTLSQLEEELEKADLEKLNLDEMLSSPKTFLEHIYEFHDFAIACPQLEQNYKRAFDWFVKYSTEEGINSQGINSQGTVRDWEIQIRPTSSLKPGEIVNLVQKVRENPEILRDRSANSPIGNWFQKLFLGKSSRSA